MAIDTLYALASGLQSGPVAEEMGERFDQFIAGRQWRCPDVWSLCQQQGTEDWELGLNLVLPEPLQKVPDWFSDVEAIVRFCTELRGQYHCDFAIGAFDSEEGGGGDIVTVGMEPPDYDDLRRCIVEQAQTLGSD